MLELNPNLPRSDRILGGLWGSLVGDALGVPVEFKDRAARKEDPVKEMRGFGTHQQPPGTWSDDGALILCTVQSLLRPGFDVQHMGEFFVEWLKSGLWTATGEVFDAGLTTVEALSRIQKGVPAREAGSTGEHSNGNGSLMRMLPMAIWFAERPLAEMRSALEEASAITHAHERSRDACVLFGLVTSSLLRGYIPAEALRLARGQFAELYEKSSELALFHNMLDENLATRKEDEILSTGYVLHTLRAALWCVLTTTSFEECVLKAVNLGGDTDTTGCVAGGLAGVLYGLKGIPADWLTVLPRKTEVGDILDRFAFQADRRISEGGGPSES